jgi:hypothetical protein
MSSPIVVTLLIVLGLLGFALSRSIEGVAFIAGCGVLLFGIHLFGVMGGLLVFVLTMTVAGVWLLRMVRS